MKEGAFGAYINAAYRQHPLWWLTPPPLPRCEACHWILRHRAGYLSEGAFMGRLGANVSGLAYSYAEYAPIGSLQHGYHRLTGFSGRSCSPTNPVRWCDSSSLATPYSGGTMGAGRWRQFEFMAAAERKPYNRASLVEMHPYSRFAGLPPEGEVLAALCLKMLMSPKAERRVNLPLRGRCRRQKGCISNGRSPVVWFSIP